MENLDFADVKLLKESVESKFGRRVLYAKDCGELSQVVFEKTGCKVSETTIKRLWNLVNSAFNPSKYTLNSLANYLNFKDFEDFIFHKDDYKKNAENLLIWEQLKSTAAKISSSTVSYLKNRCGIGFEKTIKREFFAPVLKSFLSAPENAYALVGPDGIGKTVTVLHYIDEILEKNNQPDDVVWYFNCSSDNSLNVLNDNLKEVLSSFLGLGGKMSYKEYFEAKPAALNGRLILVLDDVSTPEILDVVLSIIALYKNENYFKAIITVSPSVWQKVGQKVTESTRSCWYDAAWDLSTTAYTNLPLLTYDEAITVLKNCNALTIHNIEHLVNFCIKGSFRIPCCLELLAKNPETVLTQTDLFRIYTQAYLSNYKCKRFVDFFLFTTNYGFDTPKTDKDRLAKLIDEYGDEFIWLVSSGIFSMEDEADSFGKQHSVVKFTYEEFFDYHLSCYWRNEFGISDSLFLEVSSYYDENPTVKTKLFAWFIRFAFDEARVGILKKMFRIIDTYIKVNSDKTALKRLYCSLVKDYPKFSGELLLSEQESSFYLKEYVELDFHNGFILKYIEAYCARKEKAGDKLLGITFKMLDFFLKGDKTSIEAVYSEIEGLGFDVSDSFQYMLFLTCELLYSYSCYGCIENKILKSVSDFALVYYMQKRDFVYSEFILLDALMLTGCYSVSKTLFEQIPLLTPKRKLQYAYALFKMKNKDKAKLIYNENIDLYFDKLPDNSFYYGMLKCCRLSYEFTKNENFKKLGLFFSKQTGSQYYTDIFEKIR
ncbi:MAG: orc1/cdc6 family replication initiation protein [Bacteroidales bacterium]|nr:orc1/cdc6 family replication initiation protein [Bacteroidales bacterium]